MPFDASDERTDEDLLLAFGAGEASAAQALTLRLTPRAFGYASRVLKDVAEAEDVVQEAMMRLWKIAPDWRTGEAQVSTWLYRVVANLCTDRLRKTGRGVALDAIPEPEDDTPGAVDQMVAAERAKALDDALDQLPGRQKQAVVLRHIEGLSNPEIARIMEPVARPMPLYPKRPQVVLVVGVNGSGKTTTIGKLASQFKAAGKSVVIAAGDTFRAAAVEQLQVWGDRAGVPVLTAPEGSDPASLAFEAMTKAEAEGADLLMIDTAGRLHNRQDLMEELAKIVRVIRKKDPDAPHNTLLVLDATTGQNALSQVEIFQKIADVSGLVMTKLDGTAKGGVLVALANKFGLPIHAVGVGEGIDDLQPFEPEEFARALTGADA